MYHIFLIFVHCSLYVGHEVYILDLLPVSVAPCNCCLQLDFCFLSLTLVQYVTLYVSEFSLSLFITLLLPFSLEFFT